MGTIHVGAWVVLMKRLGCAHPHNLIHYNRLNRGGHFAAWEQPQLFADEMRASFRSLRNHRD